MMQNIVTNTTQDSATQGAETSGAHNDEIHIFRCCIINNCLSGIVTALTLKLAMLEMSKECSTLGLDIQLSLHKYILI